MAHHVTDVPRWLRGAQVGLPASPAGQEQAHLRRPDVLFRVVFVTLAALTLAVALAPSFHGHLRAPAADLALDTIACVISMTVAALAWVRFRERGDSGAAFHAGAFLALTVGYLVAVFVTIARDAAATNGAVADEQIYVFVAARVLMAVLFVVGEFATRGGREVRRPMAVLLVPAAVVVVIALISYGGAPSPSPAIFLRPATDGFSLPHITAVGFATQIVVAVLLLVAARSVRSQWQRGRSIGDAWVAVGLLFAAFAELHWAVYPSGHPGHISTGDLLRLAGFVALLCGIEAEARTMMGRLRLANFELSRLRETELAGAAIEERSRLARELHDGLAQELWLAKLRIGQLTSLADLPEQARPLAVEAEAAVDMGLAEARQAVMALRLAPEAELTLSDLMGRYVEDFQDRFGLRAEFTSDADGSAVPPRTQAEVLRIAQEALANARHHAAATVVGVRLEVRDGLLCLHVADNGRGFDPSSVRRGSYGLASMHERAAVVGGSLTIDSAPGEGTRVVLTAPLAAASGAAKGAVA